METLACKQMLSLSTQDLPLQAGTSSLIDSALANEDLPNAMALLSKAQSKRQKLDIHTVNSALHSLAKTGDLKQMSEIILKLAKTGLVADKYTYTALLTACSYADAGELGFTIWR